MGELDDVQLQYQDGKTPPIKVKTEKRWPNSAMTNIRRLLAEGFRGNKFYYRNDNKRLILKVWQHEGLLLTPEQKQKFLYEVTTPDAITRARRDLLREFPRTESPKPSLAKRIRREANR